MFLGRLKCAAVLPEPTSIGHTLIEHRGVETIPKIVVAFAYLPRTLDILQIKKRARK